MLVATELFYDLFGIITLVGGVQAFVAVKSKASLVAGGICGLLLLLAGWHLQSGSSHPERITPGLVLGLIVNLALAGRFLPKFFKEKKWWPAGVEGWLGLAGLALSIVAFVVK